MTKGVRLSEGKSLPSKPPTPDQREGQMLLRHHSPDWPLLLQLFYRKIARYIY